MSKQKIQHLLESICRDDRARGRPLEELEEEKSKRILDCINADPSAAQAEYKAGWYNSPRPLLVCACDIGLSLELVQGIDRLVPEAVRQPGRAMGRLPIEEALLTNQCYGKNFAVVAFLVRRYPECLKSPTLGVPKRIFCQFPIDQGLPLLKEYLSEAEIKSASLWGTLPWAVGDPSPRGKFQAIGEIHQQESLVIRTGMPIGSYRVVESDSTSALDGGSVEVSCRGDASFPYVFGELLRVPNLTPRAIAVMDPRAMEFMIAALAPSVRGLSPRPHRPLPAGKLSSVEKVTVAPDIPWNLPVDRLWGALHQSLPGLKVLTIKGNWSEDDDSSDDDDDDEELDTGFGMLSLLSDRLQEVTVQFFPQCSIGSLLDLMDTSRVLRKLCTRQMQWTEDQKGRLFDLLATHTSLLELTLECPMGPGNVSQLVQALVRNSVLQKLVLHTTIKNEASQKALVDLVRHKHNTTLQSFDAPHTKSLSSTLNYWCQLNQLEPQLHQNHADLETAIQLLDPFLASSNHQMIFALLRSRVELWCRTA